MKEPKSKVNLKQLKTRCGATNQVLVDVIDYAHQLERYVVQLKKILR